jgi:inner membrane protein
MFIAHAPASYLWTKWLTNRRAAAFQLLPRRTHLFLGIASGLVPDLDLIYFYLIDHQQHLHHSYWTHIPIFWLAAFALAIAIAWARQSGALAAGATLALTNVFLHLTLDTVAGKIRWLSPFSSSDFVLFQVPSLYGWWPLNFLLHWTFILEIALVAASIELWRRNERFQHDE